MVNKNKRIPFRKGMLFIFGIVLVASLFAISSAFVQHVSVTVLGGVNISQEAVSPSSCIVQSDKISLSSFVDFKDCDGIVWISLDNGGNITNYSISSHRDKTYYINFDSYSFAGSSTIGWQVFAKDCYNNTYSGSSESFYVNSATQVSTTPSVADGLNGWFVTRPSFSLTNPDAVNIYYRWDNQETNLYSGSFGMDGTPDNANETGGKLDLNYWADFGCGKNEVIRNQSYLVDLISPEFSNFKPAKNSKTNDVREISVYIGNSIGLLSSGLNRNSISMVFDGLLVSPTLVNSSGSDVTVKYSLLGLSEGNHTVYVNATDNAGRSAEVNWMFEFSNENFTVNMTSPVAGIYNKKSLEINISSSEKAKSIAYIDNDALKPIWKNLCTNCNGYGFASKKSLQFGDGEHNVTFRVTDLFGNFVDRKVLFEIDSVKPKINSVSPTRDFANGTFYIKFTELNPESLTMTYGNNVTGELVKIIDLSTCTFDSKANKTKVCKINADLSVYSEQKISYSLKLIDIAGSQAVTKNYTLNADFTTPRINSLNMTPAINASSGFISGRKATFTINITEPNFKRVTYIDMNDKKPKENLFCSSLKKGICSGSKSFTVGNHTVKFIVYDKAGNNQTSDSVLFKVK